MVEYLCYDDGCHLKKYASNPSRSGLSKTSKFLSDITIVIDKMHMVGHVDKWCKEFCDPSNFQELNEV
jgi:hypothetical protein